jgi:hypothetical protein
LLRLAMCDAQGIEVQMVATIQLMSAQGAFDPLGPAACADGNHREHVPRVGVARILRHDVSKQRLGACVVACVYSAGRRVHQCRQRCGMRACHCG